MALPKFLAGFSNNNKRIQAVADPTAATDAANKQYVDNVAAGLNWKPSVKGASTGNLAIASALVNGLVHDGVTYATGERILLKNQTTALENGIRVIVAAGASPRAEDANTSAEIRNMVVRIESGTVHADQMWQLTTDNPVMDTTSLVFTQFTGGGSAYVAGSGLAESPAGTFNVGSGNGIQVTADAINVDTAVVVRKFAANCAATTNPQTFVHGLGSGDVMVQVVEVGAPSSIVIADVTVDATNIIVDFGGAPTAAQYRVIGHV